VSEADSNKNRPDCAFLWLGDARREEFAPAWAALNRCPTIPTYPGWSDADLPRDDLAPALIVVAQGSPGEFVEADVVRLRRRYPTAALLRIVGSWCEGELRTSPPPGAVRRVWWHQAAAMLRADLERLEAGERPDWGLPATATDEETLRSATRMPPAKRRAAVRIGVVAADPFAERLLHDFCDSESRYSQVSLEGEASGEASPQAILWDVPFGATERERECRRLVQDYAAARIVALANFPRRDEVELLRKWGVAAVVGKPASNACLSATIDELL